MPKYQITAPDGRVLTIEGPRPPNQDDAAKLFATLPPKNDPNYAKDELNGTDTFGGKQAPTDANSVKVAAPPLREKIDPTDPNYHQILRARASNGVGFSQPPPDIVPDMALVGGGGTAGQIAGAEMGPAAPIAIPVLGALGAGSGEYVAQKRRIAAGEQDKIQPGGILGSALFGLIPGAPLAQAGLRSIVREAGKQGATGLAAKTLQTAVDEGRSITPVEAALSLGIPAAGGALAQKIQASNPEIQSAVLAANAAKTTKAQTLEAAKELGAFVTPSDVNPSFWNKRLESLAGPADVRRGAAFENQKVANQVAAEALGLPKNTELTPDVFKSVREEAGKPYETVRKIAEDAAAKADAIRKAKFTATDPHQLAIQKNDPATRAILDPLEIQANADIEALKRARATMNDNRPPYAQADPVAMQKFRDASAQADKLESDIEAAAISAGKPELVGELRAGRKQIAKSHDIEKAVNLGDANVSLPVLARLLNADRPFEGNLKTMAQFAEAFPRNATEGAKTMPFNLSKTEAITGGMLATAGGLATGNPLTAAALALVPPVASNSARVLALSKPYQKAMANIPPPNVEASPDQIAAAIRLLSQAAGGNEQAAKLFDQKAPADKSAFDLTKMPLILAQ